MAENNVQVVDAGFKQGTTPTGPGWTAGVDPSGTGSGVGMDKSTWLGLMTQALQGAQAAPGGARPSPMYAPQALPQQPGLFQQQQFDSSPMVGGLFGLGGGRGY